MFKNTVLFFALTVISCGNNLKTDKLRRVTDGTQHNDKRTTNEMVKQNQDDNNIIVGANQIEAYLQLLQGKRVGIVANQTSVVFSKPKDHEHNTNSYTHLVDSLLFLNVNVTKVFSPEHGFRGKADAGEMVKDGVDTKTQLPIYSLHGKHKKPTTTQLKDLDIMIFDIQDVGVRFYTYISTLHYVMEACAEHNIPLIILDRPNPNGNYVDGPVLEIEHSSFLGMHPVPLVHGMTIGEYANMINGEGWLNKGVVCNTTVIKMKNYTHDRVYSLPIRPSPNLPNDQAIYLYPSLGLFEGTNVNAGRGTEFQFQRYGAPFLDKTKYSFNYTPVPNFGSKHPKHKNSVCYGVDLSNINVERHFTLQYIIDAYNNSTDKAKFFNTSSFTTHAGTETLQKQIENGLSEEIIKISWQKDLALFKKVRKTYLLYENK